MAMRVKKAQLNALKREFEILEMKLRELVTNYINGVMIIVNNMKSLGKIVSEIKIVEKILKTLTEKFNFIVCAIKESKDIDELTIDEL